MLVNMEKQKFFIRKYHQINNFSRKFEYEIKSNMSYNYTYVKFIPLHNFRWRIVQIIMCLVVFIPFKTLKIYFKKPAPDENEK